MPLTLSLAYRKCPNKPPITMTPSINEHPLNVKTFNKRFPSNNSPPHPTLSYRLYGLHCTYLLIEYS